MREGWTYKKLGEVCEIICGQDYKNVESPDGKYPIYGTGGIMGYANQFRCPAFSIIVGRKGSINNPIYVEENFWNVDTAFGIVPSKESLLSKFFYYFCKKYDFTKHNVAVTIPSLRRIDLLKIPIPVPPLSEQQRIVSELDLLSSIIEKKKAQQKEYDQLAQSIFYDMFGDPVTNEKGWEVKKLEDVCYHITDGDHMPPPKSDKGIPFITIANIDKDKRNLDFSNSFFVPQEYYDNIKEERKARINDMLYTVTGSYGIPVIIRTTRPFCFQRHIALIRPNQERVLTTFLFNWALCPSVKAEADKVATGIAQKTVGLNSLRQFIVPLPPLPLQQSFASKIEAIERQKALIQQSITETESLFNSRMDYYFD